VQRKEPTAAVLPTVHLRTLAGPLPTLRDFAGSLALPLRAVARDCGQARPPGGITEEGRRALAE